ncbi:N-acetylglucosamine-1-phosphotransferase subunit gamma [Portunus trituberculatus]|uniref:N-acetylglucosamine-1-phosphotransferase subunit gamma n=1 Tax=Portunus trituberculatus TaxID=210409 RepID=A0A5B7E2M7_PORTR|nr:N-acetylglucosamine-1-phosphotransferase subunit gamma [Portunus trituberculatus]
MKPAKFSGPEHLQELFGKCFKYRDQKYEYVLCPFHNITQEDIQAYYEPYKGVLGYLAKFKTPLVCGINAMVVYPRLPESLQRQWDEVEQNRLDGYLTEKTATGRDAHQYQVYHFAGIAGKTGERTEKWWLRERRGQSFVYNHGFEKQLQRIFVQAGFYLSPDIKKSLLYNVTGRADESCKAALDAALSRVSELEEELRLKEDIIKELEENKKRT